MSSFSIEIPATIHFGPGSRKKLREATAGARHEVQRILVLSGAQWLTSSGWMKEISEVLSGMDLETLACAEGEPCTESVAAALESARSVSPSMILAIGGGSVLDTAKALSVLLRHGGPVTKFLEGVPECIPVPGPGVPWVAVPTTAGTGSEVTKNAVIRVTGLGVKRSMRSAHMLARAVIVDPELTLSLPARVTGMSGLDALTQLVEAYVTPKSNAFVRSLIEGAFGPMLACLERLAAEPRDIDSRSAASYGALVSGISLANAGLGAAHGFAAALGGMFGVPHGLACALCLPHVLEANAAVIGDSVGRLVMSTRAAPSADADPVRWLAGKVNDILLQFGLPLNLGEYGIPAERISEIAQMSSGSSMSGNPRQLSVEEREKILSKIVLGPSRSVS